MKESDLDKWLAEYRKKETHLEDLKLYLQLILLRIKGMSKNLHNYPP
jgi:hypothetical protein